MKLFSRHHTPDIPADRAEGDKYRVVVGAGGYSPDTLVVAAGGSARVVFHRHDGSMCSEEVVFPAQGVRVTLTEREDVAVELPASDPGEYDFHCGMNMLHGRLIAR